MSKKGENIYKRKDGRWEGRYKKGFSPNGKAVYGYCYGKTYQEAKKKLENCKIKVYEGVDNSAAPAKKLFSAYCDDWLLYKKSHIKESTYVKYNTAIEKHIKPFLGGYIPERITGEIITEYTDRLISVKKLSSKSVKDIIVVLKSILKYVSRFHKTVDFSDLTVPKQSAKEIRVLSCEEQQRFVDYLLDDMDSCKFGTLFALMTGLRIGEVCALRNADISFGEKTVTVRETMQRIKNLNSDGKKTKIIFSNPKSDSSFRIVPLTETAFELCKKVINPSSPNAFLLTGSETRFIEPRVLQYRIKKYSSECGIEDLHFHVLRHTFATRCVEVGFEIKSLSEVLGHSTPRITLERYVHSSIEFKRQNMIKLEAVGL